MTQTTTPSKSALEPVQIAPEFQHKLTTQDYSPRPRIEGVQLFDLKQMIDDGGNFMELMRFKDNGEAEAVPGFYPRQTSFSIVLPGAIKAFHLHYNQDDVWFVPPSDRMLVGLIDCRDGSPSKNVSMRVILGAGRGQLLLIPRGVAHGVSNQNPTPGTIFYYVNQQFDINNADERRLPWDIVGEDFWKMTPG